MPRCQSMRRHRQVGEGPRAGSYARLLKPCWRRTAAREIAVKLEAAYGQKPNLSISTRLSTVTCDATAAWGRSSQKPWLLQGCAGGRVCRPDRRRPAKIRRRREYSDSIRRASKQQRAKNVCQESSRGRCRQLSCRRHSTGGRRRGRGTGGRPPPVAAKRAVRG